MLSTDNAGAIVPGSGGRAGYHTVEMLKATTVKSVGRVVKVGEVVEISDEDYRFLKPYEFCKDYEAEEVVAELDPNPSDAAQEYYNENTEPVEETETAEDNDLTNELVEDITEFVNEVKETVAKGKRKNK